MQGKIICVGFEKTGTTSLGEALKILGYSVKENCPRALIPALKKNYKKLLQIINNFDAVVDKPWFMIYKELDQRLPGSKFILTLRANESWYKSVSRHFSILRTAQHEWIYGRGKGIPKEHKENTLETYSRHNREVIDYFYNRPQDLLILDFSKGDAWEKLCDFLVREVPNDQFPHLMKSANDEMFNDNLRLKFKLFRRKIKNYLLIKYIIWKGYL